jgi:tetratricopeptide (TPR) repeat protein
MTLRRRWLLLCALLCADRLAAGPPVETPAAFRLWEQGQEAMRNGHTDEAVRCYYQSLWLDPKLARNFLSLAAAHVSRGEEAEAARWLARYVEAQPDHHVIRLQYAEMLLRLGKTGDGRAQLERFIADVQDRGDLADAHVLDCHTRLLRLAEDEQDEYAEHLHRGIGLYLLACQRSQLPDDAGGLQTEALLCRAAAELGLARRERPDEARPCWYLHAVWSRLGQQQPAARWLRAAEAEAPFSYLTPAERRDLRSACRHLDAERRRP